MTAIEVKGLTKKYGAFTAVNQIDFIVEEGELFAFLGENGAGKSTTINMLCTILEKTAGKVEICGYELGKQDDSIRNAIGIVFQNSVLDNKLTVKENLYSRGSFYGLNKAQIEARLKEFEDCFEMRDIWNRKYEKLSGGQRRRVDIMRALLHEPRVLFLDEPTTGLDPKSRKMVWDYISYLRQEKNMTIFLTTHYMEETKEADHVVILDKGQIICCGTPAELKTKYAASRLVWYTQSSTEAEEIIEKIPCTKGIQKKVKYEYDVDHYNIICDVSGRQMTDFLYEYRDIVEDYEYVKGTMDDVFLQLTGKEMAS